MPVSFNSPARNLFLLGSTGATVVSNFFKTIDRSAGTDGVYIPDEIKYNSLDQKYLLAGSAKDGTTKGFGWFEKRDQAGSAEWDVRVEATQSGVNTTLRAMELDSNDNLIVVGKTADIPWIAKYSNGGVIDWQSTTNSGDVEYTGVTSDSNGQYYACGNTPTSGDAQAFVEKFDTNGNPGWGKSAFMLGRDVILSKIAANDRGEVVAVGYIEDDTGNKGYIVKIDTNTGEVLWDRTLQNRTELPFFPGYFIKSSPCNDVYIDSKDQIYIIGSFSDGFNIYGSYLIKYSPEGNIIWQRETPSNGDLLDHQQVKSDGETEQTIVLSRYFSFDNTNNDGALLLSKYSKDGSLVWRRTLRVNGGWMNFKVNLDADPSFYYVLFTDDFTDEFSFPAAPDRYTFGKVSSSGNGLGAFEYTDGGYGLTFGYLPNPITDKIGRLSDGSVRNDTSDLITYPFNANKLLFDDLATQVSNKKRQMDGPDSFEYSGSPAIRPADFQELNLLGDNNFVVSGDDIIVSTNETVLYAYVKNVAGSNIIYDGVTETSATVTGLTSSNISNSIAKFNTGSIQLPYNNTLILFPVPSIPSNSFVTVEFWKYIDTTSGFFDFIVQLDSTSDFVLIQKNGSYNTSGISTGGGTWTDTLNVWRHYVVAVDYSNGTIYTALNGQRSTNSNSLPRVNLIGDPVTSIRFGKDSVYNGSARGFLDEIRVTTGDIYNLKNSSTYTVPSSPVGLVSKIIVPTFNWLDQSGKGNNGVVNGATLNASGYWEFDAEGETITLSNVYALGTEDFTFEFWFRADSAGTGVWQYFFANKEDFSGPFVRIGIHQTTNQLRFYTEQTDQTNVQGLGVATVLDDTWHHAMFVRSGTGCNIYLDGTLDNSVACMGGDIGNAVDDWIIGAQSSDGIGRFNGDLGEFRFYPRALTAAQVFQNYNATRYKYDGVKANTSPKLGPAIVYDGLLLNYDFTSSSSLERYSQIQG